MCGVVDTPEGQDAIQGDPDRLSTGPIEHHEVQQSQVQSLHLGRGSPHCQYKLGDVRIEHSPAEKDWGYWWMEAGHEPAACPRCTEIQPDPGLHPEQRGQQVREVLLPLCSAL